jgi:peroxiredoxin
MRSFRVIVAACVAASVSCQSKPALSDVKLVGAERTIALSDYLGKQPVVLLFMRGYTAGMACYFCGVQTREYKAAYDKLRAAGAEVLMVLPLAKDAAGYVKTIGASADPAEPGFTVPFPVVLDPDGKACTAFDVKFDKDAPDFPVFEPATIVLGKDGKPLLEHHGAQPGDRPKVDDVLKALGVKSTSAAPRAPEKPVTAREWKSHADGMALAKSQQRPVLLEFHAVW